MDVSHLLCTKRKVRSGDGEDCEVARSAVALMELLVSRAVGLEAELVGAWPHATTQDEPKAFSRKLAALLVARLQSASASQRSLALTALASNATASNGRPLYPPLFTPYKLDF